MIHVTLFILIIHQTFSQVQLLLIILRHLHTTFGRRDFVYSDVCIYIYIYIFHTIKCIVTQYTYIYSTLPAL